MPIVVQVTMGGTPVPPPPPTIPTLPGSASPNALAPDIPHCAYPFNLTANGVDVVEGDSLEEVYACVQAIVNCPVGTRDDLPPFGIPWPAFANAPINRTSIENAIRRWEPRAQIQISEYSDLSDLSVRHLHIAVGTQP